MSARPILLKVLIQQRKLTRYGMFRAAYENAAKKVDRRLVGTAPSRAQLHRWISGLLKRLPYTDHCRVLETMFPGWTADQLFAPCPDDLVPGAAPAPGPVAGAMAGAPAVPAPGVTAGPAGAPAAAIGPVDHAAAAPGAASPPAAPVTGGAALPAPGAACGCATRLADVTAVFATRAEFTYAMPPHAMFDAARRIRAAGLSLNLLCQQYPDQRLHRLLEGGARLQCLFLDPDGAAIAAREREEGYTDRFLTTLTRLNIEVLSRVRDRLPEDAKDRLALAVYDETIRFSIVLVDDDECVVQPYLPRARGVDSPTFLLRRGPEGNGLYATFERVYCELWERSRPV